MVPAARARAARRGQIGARLMMALLRGALARLSAAALLLGLAVAPGLQQQGTSPFPATDVLYPSVPWPLPRSIEHQGNSTVVLAATLALSCGSAADGCDPAACAADGALDRALHRYAALLSPLQAPPPTASEIVLAQIAVCVTDAAVALGPGVNETHSLSVPAALGQPIHIAAASQFGAMQALESLSQLVSLARPGRIAHAPVEIADRPRWGVRGLMVNPAGRFMSVAFLKRVVDGLAMQKMNYLHIHFTDVSSFSVASDKYPQLAAKGRISRLLWRSNDSSAVYTKPELRSLVAYAAERGVRIVPEFDMPGHGVLCLHTPACLPLSVCTVRP